MTSYLGNLGAMVPVECPAELGWSTSRPVSTTETLGGRRFATIGPRGLRAWQVRVSDVSVPSGLARLSAFARGDMGAGPFWYLSDWAVVTNCLDPVDAELSVPWGPSATVAGPVELPGGAWAARHQITSSSTWSSGQSANGIVYAPALPGQTVTLAAFLRAPGARILGLFENAAGEVIGQTEASAVSESWERRSWTTVVPAAAVRIRLATAGPGAIALPTVTYTSSLAEPDIGQGARAVIVTGESRAATLAHARTQYGGQSYTIEEVG